MNLKAFLSVLSENPDASISVVLPDRSTVPPHFHITEVGRVQKDFIDCGGTVRSTTACVLQAWVAHDADHRLEAGKLARIIELAATLLKSLELPVEIEYEHDYVAQFPVVSTEVTSSGIVIHLGTKHTACLAPQLCLVESSCGPDCEPGTCC